MSSLDQNPPNATNHITSGGTDWLWTVFALMLVSLFGMIGWSMVRPRGTRFFHNIAVIILATATLAYFSMASNLGSTPITAEFAHGNPGTRQIWYVRYIQWFITFPLLLLLLLFPSGLSLSDILTTTFFAWFVVVSGLVGALVSSSYKWGYYVFGVFALFYIWGVLLGVGPRTTFSAGATVRSGYIRGSGFLALITFLYPIAWAVSEGGNVISPNKEMVFYGILDLILGPVFLYYYLFGLRDIDYGTYGIHSGKFSDGPATGEKGPAVAAASNYPTSAARTEPGTTAAAPQAVGTAAPAV
ncbi:hypothetical protein NLI96_g4790 [Meripilus lineatus]|uniref:Heat shock protein 30 n=1 Tax=Meripilus lineatus TaxID=2056292 RepID=A0AAD5YJR8_9APHY|nr:hypothetical protein NLI96_g4790 [Physisporinus lineatus]